MQRLGFGISEEIKRERVKSLEKDMKEFFATFSSTQSMIICPFCNYQSVKTHRGSGKIFVDAGRKSFKCFNCGIWRRL